jgi:hypothetical protein
VPQPHAGPTEAEQRLEEAQQLRLQLQSLAGQLQAQVLENKRVSRLKGELEEFKHQSHQKRKKKKRMYNKGELEERLLALGQAARIPGSRRRMTKR